MTTPPPIHHTHTQKIIHHNPGNFPDHTPTHVEVSREDDHIVYSVRHQQRSHDNGVQLLRAGRSPQLLLEGEEVEVADEGETAVGDDGEHSAEALGGEVNVMVDRAVVVDVTGVDEGRVDSDEHGH